MAIASPSVVFVMRSEELLINEAKLQLQLAGPLAVANLLQKCIQLTSIMFVGHLGALPLSGVSIATSVVNVTGFNFLFGMSSALDTLCGQSHGAKQYHMLGADLQTAILVLSIVSIPFSLLLAFTQQILMAAGQDAEISREAGIYCKWLIPSLFSYALLQCETRFLQAQNIVLPTMVSTGFCTLLHLFTCWTLVFRSELGFRGAALAISISYWINALLLAAYIKASPACTKTRTGFSKPDLRSTVNFLRLATPSAAMLCLELWAFEIMILMSGLLPNGELEISVLSITLNASCAVYTIPAGLGQAISARVSNELGAGKQQAARLAVYVMLLMVVIEAAFVAITIILVRSVWGYAYSDDTEVVKYISDMTPLLATSTFLDAIQSVLSGIARGCGWQKFGALVNIGAYYIVGVPAAVFLAFFSRLSGKGLWMGIMFGTFTQLVFFLCFTLSADWEKEAKKIEDKVQVLSFPTECEDPVMNAN
ncbi:protein DETOXIFICATION 16-like [Nymphaea colorata]|nr:protein DETOXIFICATION 16-like [Nymphaea colorata]